MVHVKDNWYIDSDNLCFTLKCKGKNKDGEDVFRSEGYYGTFEGALNGLRKKYMRDITHKSDISLGDAYKRFDALTDEFSELINV